MTEYDYVLVTSAFNEEKYLERTIRSVAEQTLPPVRWVIVSDGSTDGTDALICRYAKIYDFIVYLRTDRAPEETLPKFGFVATRKVNAIRKAVGMLDSVPYRYIGNLDGDVSFGANMYEVLIRRFVDRPQLGLAGGFIYNNIDGKLRPYFTNPRNAGGPLQLFRRECYEDIGGYVTYGHEDTIAGIMARMHGWKTGSFADLVIEHHKVASCTGWRRCRSKYLLGAYDYLHSDTILWEILRCLKELRDTPYVIGSFLRLAGYFNAVIQQQRLLPPDVHQFVRNEQYQTLARAVQGKF